MAQCSVLWLVAVCCSEVWPGVVMWGVVYHCVGVYAVLFPNVVVCGPV